MPELRYLWLYVGCVDGLLRALQRLLDEEALPQLQ
jgi:hypothetical protein